MLKLKSRTDYNTENRPLLDLLVCYGFGSLEVSKNARAQLALSLLLATEFDIPRVEFFEPLCTNIDKTIVGDYGFVVLTKNPVRLIVILSTWSEAKLASQQKPITSLIEV